MMSLHQEMHLTWLNGNSGKVNLEITLGGQRLSPRKAGLRGVARPRNNRPISRSKNSHRLSQRLRANLPSENEFTCTRIKNDFHDNSFPISLALKQAWGNSEIACCGTHFGSRSLLGCKVPN